MYMMRVAAWISGDDYAPFFWVNALLLTGLRAAIAVMLYVAIGARALCFALAPTLLVYGTVNWDLLAVAFATAALLRSSGGGTGPAGAAARAGCRREALPGAAAWCRSSPSGCASAEPDGAIVLGWAAAGAGSP